MITLTAISTTEKEMTTTMEVAMTKVLFTEILLRIQLNSHFAYLYIFSSSSFMYSIYNIKIFK